MIEPGLPVPESIAGDLAKALSENAKLRAEIESRQRQLQEWYGKLMARDEEVKALNLQNDELKKALGSTIQYVEHSRIGHLINEETLEIRHDETCFKCTALRVYFNAENQQTDKRVEGGQNA